MRVAYDEVADSYAEAFRSTEPEQPVELAMIEHFASLLSGERRVLDAGCGAGRLIPVLAAMECLVEGVDLSSGMVRRAQRDHPTFTTRVASIADLPHHDGAFDGYFSWYSTIHSPDEQLACIFGEARRVLRPGGVLLAAFQAGEGARDVSDAYRRHGHEITLERYNRTPDQLSLVLTETGFDEVARLERRPADVHERDGQAVLIAQLSEADPAGPGMADASRG